MARIAADYESGLTVQQIAIREDESDSYIHRWLTKAGVTFRPQGAQLGNRNKLGGRLQ